MNTLQSSLECKLSNRFYFLYSASTDFFLIKRIPYVFKTQLDISSNSMCLQHAWRQVPTTCKMDVILIA